MLYVSVAGLTNVAVANERGCLFTRAAAGGLDSMVRTLADRRGLTVEHSQQWLQHVGLLAELDDVDGDEDLVAAARTVLEEGVHELADTVRNSLNFYRTQEGAEPVEEGIVTGPAVAIPGFVETLSEQLKLPLEAGRRGGRGQGCRPRAADRRGRPRRGRRRLMLAAVVGAVFGSFLNVVAYRLPRGESLARPRSRCPQCETPIRPYDNVPVLSWLALRGRCRSCKGAIPVRYPLVEAVTGLLCALVVIAKGPDEDALLGLALVLLLVPITLIDLDHRIIPNKLTLAGAVIAPRIRAAHRSGRPARAPDRGRRGGRLLPARRCSRTRAGWGWETSSSPRSWASSWAGTWRRRSSSPWSPARSSERP